jgi:hypothetical protein
MGIGRLFILPQSSARTAAAGAAIAVFKLTDVKVDHETALAIASLCSSASVNL